MTADGERIHGRQGEALLRAADSDAGAYVFVTMPAAASIQNRAPVGPGFIHSSGCLQHRIVWPLVAASLAGTHTGRVLASGSNDPRDVLDGLIGAVDDLIRLRVRHDATEAATRDTEPATTTAKVDHTPARAALVGLLAGLDDSDENDSDDDIAGALDGFLDNISEEQPFPVALGAIEIAGYLMKQLRLWTGQSQQEILTEMAAELTRRSLNQSEGA